ncbi:MAG: tRNA-intron lyase [Candidatus Thermoplasmatota archaeon]|nr:tRNA-intron lyase [Candidatus Thermoplasmatota archaeon]
MQRSSEPHRALCDGISFLIEGGKGPAHIQSKYRVGRIASGILYLNPYEVLYLLEKKRIRAENPMLNRLENLLPSMKIDEGFIDRFYLFQQLKSRGFVVKMEAGEMFYRRDARESFQGPVRLVREDVMVSFSNLYGKARCIYAAIDDDHDITYFIVESADPHGIVETTIPHDVHLLDLQGQAATSEPGIPPWMGTDLSGIRLLNIFEASLLSGKINNGNPVMHVFQDLVSRGFIVRTGFKYGANFRIYGKSLSQHAEFLVHVIDGTEEWYKISRAVRVAQGVRKEMIFAGYSDEGKIGYIRIVRVRDPFLYSDQIWDSKSSMVYENSE